MRIKQTLKNMTPEQRVVYYRELRKLMGNGVDKWLAIRFSRRVAFGMYQRDE